MSEKLQEWIEAVEDAVQEAKTEAIEEQSKVSWNAGPSWQAEHRRYAANAEQRATRLTELAAYLRDGAMPTGAGILAAERATRQIGGMMAALAVGYFAMCCYALPAPPAALATPGGEE